MTEEPLAEQKAAGASCLDPNPADLGAHGERRGPPSRVSCPVHGVYIHLREVEASADPSSAARRLVIHQGLVYDVTDFQHPGGNDLLEPYFGKDITDAFIDAGHSRYAEELLQTLCVGILKEAGDSQHTKPQTRACACNLEEGDSTSPTDQAPDSTLVRKRHAQTAAAAATATATATAAAGGGKDASSTDEGEGSEPYEEGSYGGAGSSNQQQQQQQKSSKKEVHELIDFSKALVPQVYAMTGEDYKKAVESHCSANTVFKLLPWDLLLMLLPIMVYHIFGAVVGVYEQHQLRASCHLICCCRCSSSSPAPAVAAAAAAVAAAGWSQRRKLIGGWCRWCGYRLVVSWVSPHISAWGFGRLLGLLSLTGGASRVVVVAIGAAWPGGLTGYVMYDMIHYATHHFAFLERLEHIRAMRRYHLKHHYKYPTLGFGLQLPVAGAAADAACRSSGKRSLMCAPSAK
ncbi:hypothetical protein Emed_000996 [Eimeria media]